MNLNLYPILKSVATYNVLTSIIIILSGFLVSKISLCILKKIFGKKKKERELINILKRPLDLMIVILFLYIGLSRIELLSSYQKTLGRIFEISILLAGSFLTVKIVSFVSSWYTVKKLGKRGKDLSNILTKITAMLVSAVALIYILNSLGVEIGPLLASLGVAGLAVAFALRDTLANFFSGIYLTADKPIRTNDFIELEDGKKGRLTHIGWRSSIIETRSENEIVIPNKKLAEETVTNYNKPRDREKLILKIGVGYDSDIKEVKETIDEVIDEIREEEDINEDEKGVVLDEFGDSAIKFSFWFYISNHRERFDIKDRVNEKIVSKFEERDINIPYETTHVYVEEVES